MATHYTYYTSSEDPSIPIKWTDFADATVDLSAASFSLILEDIVDGSAAATKTTGITGYASLQGTSPNDYNCLVTWATGELATAGAGDYKVVLRATVSGRGRPWDGELYVHVLAVPT